MLVVEWDTRLGIPLYALSALLGVLLVTLSLVRLRPRPAAAPAQPQADGAIKRAVLPESGDWVPQLISMARAIELQEGASVRLDEGSGVPFGLRLERLTPEGERRAMDQFAAFLAAIPTPPRVKVSFIGASATGVPRHHIVNGALRRHFHSSTYQVVSQESWVDVLFFTPDARWEGRPFLFLDR